MGDDAFTEVKVKLAELSTEFKNVAHDVKGALMEIKEKASIRDLSNLESQIYAKLASLEKEHNSRLVPIEALITWGGRIIVGTVLLALLALVLNSTGKVKLL